MFDNSLCVWSLSVVLVVGEGLFALLCLLAVLFPCSFFSCLLCCAVLCCVVLFVFVCSSSVACLLARSLSEPVLTMKYQSHESCCDTRQTELAFQADGHGENWRCLIEFSFAPKQESAVRAH